ncbi:DUF6538 domain-containing protein [Azospirillum sp. sgz302134]
MPIQTNVRRRGAAYHFRCRVPADLVNRFGRLELARTLGTSDPTEARHYGAVAAELVYALFTAVRDDESMTRDDIAALVRQFYEAELREYRTVEELARFSPRAARQKAHLDAQRPHLTRALAGDIAEGKTLLVQAIADDLIECNSLNIAKNTSQYAHLCAGLARAYLAALTEIDRASSGINLSPELLLPQSAPAQTVAAAPPAPAGTLSPDRLVSTSSERAPESRMALSELLENLLRRRALEGRSASDYQVAVRMFEEFAGPRPIGEVTKRDFLEFRKLLEETPTNAKQRFQGKTLPEAAALNRRRTQPFPTLESKTINKWLSPLRVLFAMAAEELWIDDNPAADIRARTTKADRRRDKRHPFSAEQLAHIFQAPLFVGCESDTQTKKPGTHKVKDHRFWVPLVALFTGARPTELAQLLVTDLIQRDGIWMLNITTSADEGDDKSSVAPKKHLKSENAVRLIPVHPQLEHIGFLRYVQAQKNKGYQRIFHSWKPSSSGEYISTFPRFFNRTFLPSLGVKSKKTSFYSFRHTFKDAQRRAGMHPGIADALFGHADQTTAGIYGSGGTAFTPRQLADAMGRISYEEIDLGQMAR